MKTRLKKVATWFTQAGVAVAGLYWSAGYLVNGQSIVFVAGAAATLAIVGGLSPRPPDPSQEKP